MYLHWTKKPNGKEVLILNGYTYFLKQNFSKTILWHCTYGGKCKSRISTTNEEDPLYRDIVSSKEGHNHARPTYVINNGFYVKI
uniref:SFRICE_000689 n=1 Tax=Spodoptera frugiperda TaxID=7108 RepID=A0A2H1V0B9_SPOFR